MSNTLITTTLYMPYQIEHKLQVMIEKKKGCVYKRYTKSARNDLSLFTGHVLSNLPFEIGRASCRERV